MPFEIPRVPVQKPVRTVRIGATATEGGTRTSTVTIGGATAMPFHLFEGAMPHPPALAMEVFDTPPKRYPKALQDVFEDVLSRPAEMARRCVEQFGAELISVRLEGTHPDKGDKSAEEAATVVKAVLTKRGRAFDHHRAFPLRKEQRGHAESRPRRRRRELPHQLGGKGQLQDDCAAVWRTATVS